METFLPNTLFGDAFDSSIFPDYLHDSHERFELIGHKETKSIMDGEFLKSPVMSGLPQNSCFETELFDMINIQDNPDSIVLNTIDGDESKSVTTSSKRSSSYESSSEDGSLVDSMYHYTGNEKVFPEKVSKKAAKKNIGTKDILPRSNNAVMAKIAREKKKQYIKELESNNSNLSKENSKLKDQVSQMKSEIDTLTDNILYLQNVFKNESMLSKILSAVDSEQNNILRLQRSTSNDHSYGQVCKADDVTVKQSNKLKIKITPALKRKADNSTPAGICVHVQNQSFSIEMCAQCNKNSTKHMKETKDDPIESKIL